MNVSKTLWLAALFTMAVVAYYGLTQRAMAQRATLEAVRSEMQARNAHREQLAQNDRDREREDGDDDHAHRDDHKSHRAHAVEERLRDMVLRELGERGVGEDRDVRLRVEMGDRDLPEGFERRIMEMVQRQLKDMPGNGKRQIRMRVEMDDAHEEHEHHEFHRHADHDHDHEHHMHDDREHHPDARHRHLMEAVEHLEIAGLHEMAGEVARHGERMLEEQHRGANPELMHRVERLEAELREVRHLLGQLLHDREHAHDHHDHDHAHDDHDHGHDDKHEERHEIRIERDGRTDAGEPRDVRVRIRRE